MPLSFKAPYWLERCDPALNGKLQFWHLQTALLTDNLNEAQIINDEYYNKPSQSREEKMKLKSKLLLVLDITHSHKDMVTMKEVTKSSIEKLSQLPDLTLT